MERSHDADAQRPLGRMLQRHGDQDQQNQGCRLHEGRDLQALELFTLQPLASVPDGRSRQRRRMTAFEVLAFRHAFLPNIDRTGTAVVRSLGFRVRRRNAREVAKRVGRAVPRRRPEVSTPLFAPSVDPA